MSHDKQTEDEVPTLRNADAELNDEELDGVAGGAGYLKIGDIKGESVEPKHKDWINLLSVSSRS